MFKRFIGHRLPSFRRGGRVEPMARNRCIAGDRWQRGPDSWCAMAADLNGFPVLFLLFLQ